MKLRIQYILAFFSLIAFSGCAENPALFSETDGIYFGTTDTVISYSFAKYPKKTFDTILVPVKVLGNAFGTDRPIGLDILTTSGDNAAIDGTHFKVLDDHLIPANKYAGSVKVVVYRTPDLDNKVVNFSIKLKQDEVFPSGGITDKQKVTVNLAYLQQPASWGEYNGDRTGYFAGYRSYFGTWTKAKYKLILDALYDPETGVSVTEFPGSRFVGQYPIIYNSYLNQVKNYIKIKYPGNYTPGAGATLIDPETNLPIQVFPANY